MQFVTLQRFDIGCLVSYYDFYTTGIVNGEPCACGLPNGWSEELNNSAESGIALGNLLVHVQRVASAVPISDSD